MSAQDSAYAALGLRPGAPAAMVDEAYRRLIKQHHPDRTGGDGRRAAEINRAYTLLRRSGRAIAPRRRSVPVPLRRVSRPRSNKVAWGVTAGAAAFAIAASTAQSPAPHRVSIPLPADGWRATESPVVPTLRSTLTDFEEPLHTPVIDGAISEAMRFHSEADGTGAEQYSRECQNRLRQQPNLAWFDACSAFDEATVTLTGDDSTQFNGSAVVAREMAAARTVSDDVLGADSRLQKIRVQVELRLLPTLDSGQQPQFDASGETGGGAAPSGF